jgi:hypothetical protein
MWSGNHKIIILMLVAAICGGILGLYRGGRGSGVNDLSQGSLQNDQDPNSLGYALAKVADGEKPEVTLSDVEKLIDQAPKSGTSEYKIQQLLSKSMLELKLGRMLIAFNHRTDIEKVELLISSYTAEFNAKSDLIMELIEKAYVNAEIADCATERQNMLNLASKLPGQNQRYARLAERPAN